ncbi:MAG: ROK family protein [Planctomycetota bacterium]|jgi:N-acetylglucosamine repressor
MPGQHGNSYAVPGLLKRLNERKVIEVLMRQGASSRADLSRITGISPPTVSKAIESLVGMGFVERHTEHQNKTGRPGKLFSLAGRTVHVLGVAIGADGCWVATGGMAGDVREEDVVTFEAPDDYESLIDEIVNRLSGLIEANPARVLGVGVCVAGYVDHAHQEVVRCPGLAYMGGRAPGVELAKRLGCDSHLISRAQGMCLADRYRDDDLGMQSLMLDATECLNCGLYLGGRLLVGDSGLSGAMGYIPVAVGEKGAGETRFLTDLASDAALARTASERLGREMSIRDVIEYVASGGEDLNDLIDETLGYLAIGVATLVNLVDVGRLRLHADMLDLERCSLDKLLERLDQYMAVPLDGRCVIERSVVTPVQAAVAGMIEKLAEGVGAEPSETTA